MTGDIKMSKGAMVIGIALGMVFACGHFMNAEENGIAGNSATVGPQNETEPNNDLDQANKIEMGQVKGTINPAKDVDSYSFDIKSKRREIVVITLNNNCPQVAPNLILFDNNREGAGGIRAGRGDRTVKYFLDTPANKQYYVRLFSNHIEYPYTASGAIENRDEGSGDEPYTLEVRFANNAQDGILIDQYEPNDTFDEATLVEIGKEVSATLEPERDVDTYMLKYTDKKKAALEVVFENHADNIAPNMAVYDGNRRSLIVVREPDGAFKAKYSLSAIPKGEYYFRLFSNGNNYPYPSASACIDARNKARSNKPYKFTINYQTE
jgi:hypothetical protein